MQPPTHLAFNVTAFGSQLVNLSLSNISSFLCLFQLVLGLAASREIDVRLFFLQSDSTGTNYIALAPLTPVAVPQ